MKGCLYVVATPIGNLGDLSARGRDILSSVSMIAAEDTRHSRKLLDHFGIGTGMISLHEHNEASRVPAIIEKLEEGASIALISDAGTPLLSDPGSRLVAAAAAAGIPVSPIPGPAAAIAALSVAALPGEQFWFEGFLPARAGARSARLETLSDLQATMIFYVAPHRLLDDLQAMCDVFGSLRNAALARELTKIHEQVYRGSLETLLERAKGESTMTRGELVLLVAGVEAARPEERELEDTARILLEHLSPRDAARVLSRLTGAGRNEAYAITQRICGSSNSEA
ncbi:MAG: 16S rRNA (cytidine(1402)-2'-O)-methyltransferase [Gammaproteobacteria bacterium]|nr:16S rRNA (cytidine(1402)-2'-O)-methyltransferase [Gammaproteobacteria bacterium]